MSDYSEAQQLALAIFPKISGFLSCLFSLLVVVTIIRTDNQSFRTYHRLIMGISLSDMSSSFWLSLSTWPIPKDSGVVWAFGTSNSCTVQGFFNHLGMIAIFYNVSLNIYFLLVVRFRWNDSRIQRIEPFLHGIPLGWGLGTAIYAAVRGLFGNALLWCWITANYDTERWVLYYAPLTVGIVFMIGTSLVMYLHVRSIERKTNMYKSFRRFFKTDVEANRSSQQPNTTEVLRAQPHLQETTIEPAVERDYIDRFSSHQEATSTVEKEDVVRYSSHQKATIKDGTEKPTVESDCVDQFSSHQEAAITEGTTIERGHVVRFPSHQEAGITDRTEDPTVETDHVVRFSSRADSTAAQSDTAAVHMFQSRRQQERRKNSFRNTRIISRRCFWFSLGFFINWTPLYTTRLLQSISGKLYYPLLLTAAFTIPLQGIPNGLVYLYPKYQAIRQRHCDWTQLEVFLAVISGDQSAARSNGSIR